MKFDIREDKLTEFLLGLGLFVAGIIMLTKNIYVSTPMFSHGVKIGGIYFRTGVCVFPFVAGAICLFLWPERLWPKIVTGAGFLFILGVAVFSVNIRVKAVSLVKWLCILISLAGGIALMGRAVYLRRKK
jgi:peptidoglycan/LPS O-acetylase OafA/YrhL